MNSEINYRKRDASLIVRIERTPAIDALLEQYNYRNKSTSTILPKVKFNGNMSINSDFGILLSSDQEMLDYDEDLKNIKQPNEVKTNSTEINNPKIDTIDLISNNSLQNVSTTSTPSTDYFQKAQKLDEDLQNHKKPNKIKLMFTGTNNTKIETIDLISSSSSQNVSTNTTPSTDYFQEVPKLPQFKKKCNTKNKPNCTEKNYFKYDTTDCNSNNSSQNFSITTDYFQKAPKFQSTPKLITPASSEISFHSNTIVSSGATTTLNSTVEKIPEVTTKQQSFRSCKFDKGSIIITRNLKTEPHVVRNVSTFKTTKTTKTKLTRKKWTERIKDLSAVEKWHSINYMFKTELLPIADKFKNDDGYNSMLNETQSTLLLEAQTTQNNFKTKVNYLNSKVDIFKLPACPSRLLRRQSIVSETKEPSSESEIIQIEIKSDTLSIHPCTQFDENTEVFSTFAEETDLEQLEDPQTCSETVSQFNIFTHICYDYYCKNLCPNKNCPKLHHIDREVQEKLRVVPFSVLIETFGFVLNTTKLFTELLPYLIRNLQKFQENFEIDRELIKLVEAALECSVPSKLYVKNVIEILKQIGKSVKESIDSIIMCYGAGRTDICNILLDLITDEECMGDLWEIIKNLLMWRKEKLEDDTAAKLLRHCLSQKPLNLTICKGFKEFVINKNLIGTYSLQSQVEELINIVKTNTVSETSSINNNNSDALFSNDDEVMSCNSFSPEFSDDSEESNHSCRENVNNTEKKCTVEELKPDVQQGDNKFFPIPVTSNIPTPNNNWKDYFRGDNSLSKVYSNNPPLVNNYSPSNMHIVPAYNPSNFTNTNNIYQVDCDYEMLPVYNNTVYPGSFGSLILHPQFVCNSSLHNNYPTSTTENEISPKDVINLKHCIYNRDGRIFLLFLKKYKHPTCAKSLVANCVVHFINATNMSDIFTGLMESLYKVESVYMTDRSLKALLEVIAFNVIVHLEKRGKWDVISKILLRFPDWDSLITSQLFLQFLGKRNFTLMGRYIFICKMFIKANNFHWPNEIFQSDKLNLLKRCENWPYFYKHYDEQFRNSVLYQFFHSGFLNNIISVNDLYKFIRRLNGVDNFDTWFHFNNMILFLLNNYEKHFHVLKQLFRDIVNIYHPYIDTRMLRALMVFMVNELKPDEIMSFYCVCCKRDVYPEFVGNEANIYVKNNMLDNEIVTMLKYYFQIMVAKKLPPPQELTIHIVLEKPNVYCLVNLLKYSRNVNQLRLRLMDILKKYFFVTKYNRGPSIIIINSNDLMNYYNSLITK